MFVGYVAINKDGDATAFIARREPDEHLEQKGWIPVTTRTQNDTTAIRRGW